MATLTLKNVPDDLHRRLKACAERNHRSLNREAIRLLEAGISPDSPSPSPVVDEAAERARAFREQLAADGFWTTAEEVLAAVEEGRE